MPVDCANQIFADLQSHFSTESPKSFQTFKKSQMNKLVSAQYNLFHPTFCSSTIFEYSSAISQSLNSTSSVSDQITDPLLTNLPHSGLQFLLPIFDLFWSKHTFPFP